MEILLHFTDAAVEGCEIVAQTADAITIRQTAEQSWIHLPPFPDDSACDANMLLTGIVTNDCKFCTHCHVRFHGENRTFSYTVALMPSVTVDLLFRLRYLSGECHYPPMEPGTLKSSIGGSIRPDEIRRVSIGFTGCGCTYTLRNLRFSDTEPVYCKPDHAMCDLLGQWADREWPGKTRSVEELRENLHAALMESERNSGAVSCLDAYGGDTRYPMAECSDRFTVQKRGGHWWFVTPDGNAFFSTGVFGVYPGEYGWVRGNEDWIGNLPQKDGVYNEAWRLAEDEELYRRKFHGMFPADTMLYAPAVANLIRVFGENWREKWTKITKSRLREWSVNTLSMFSDPAFIRDSGMPYVTMLQRYPMTERLIFREFPDVFDPAYTAASEAYAAQLSAYAEDPRLIGYFMNNEPTFAWSEEWTLAERLLEKESSYVSKAQLITFLRARYNDDIALLNAAWHTDFADFDALSKPVFRAGSFSEEAREALRAFTAILIDRYVRLPAEACRKIAPKRLNLGMRFAGAAPLTIRTAGHFDVYSVNYYGMDPTESLRAIVAHADMPILIGEFHFGALDAGLPAGGIVPVATQADRAAAYTRYMHLAAAHPNTVGAHYFAYNDQPLWGRYDCENFQFGFVDVCHTPYAAFTTAVAAVNAQMIAHHKKEKEEH